ncbi:MAG: DeoR/GlpR family DNA-binding transcription regulator [Sphaerochaetaceae bacterium]|nr:DeoR/GlpR family DNA-binding transcription regulator [Sphaerochaetaceae bacterium]
MENWNTFTRRQEIIRMLQLQSSLSVIELSKCFGVSNVTIRGDLEVLSQRGLLVRTHGGAILPEDVAHLRMFSSTINENRLVKEQLTAKAAALVKDGDTIIIDSGSTMAILAAKLHGRKITVLTNSLPVISELAGDEDIELMVIGGAFRKSVLAAVGEFSSEMLRSINADMLFMGCSSFDLERGISCPNLNEKVTKRLMIEASRQVCIAADSTKSNRTSLYNVAAWSEIDYFITDSLPIDHRRHLEGLAVNVIMAGEY